MTLWFNHSSLHSFITFIILTFPKEKIYSFSKRHNFLAPAWGGRRGKEAR